MAMKTGVLLINLGTPEDSSVSAVRRYLRQFLSDPRVIDIHPLLRALLVNLIIVPFRAPRSAKAYKKLFEKYNGTAPLLYYTRLQTELLQASLPSNFTVEFAMRYQSPSLEFVLEKMRKANYEKIVLLPLFPQYASASSGSALQAALAILQKWWVIPHIEVISDFYQAPNYIEAVADRARAFDLPSYDKILFSYHGVPIRQLDKV